MTRIIPDRNDEDFSESEIPHQPILDTFSSDSDNEEVVDPGFLISSTVVEDETNPNGIGWFGASMLIVNAALGAGLLNFPQAFHQAGGVLIATVVQFSLMVFIVPALIILAYCSDFNRVKTLQEVLFSTWGKFGLQITSVCIAIYCFGTCITFLIIIGDQFDRVFASLNGPTFCHTWYMNRTWTILITSTCFILPLCFPKKIDFLRHASSVGVVAVFYVVFLIIAQYYKGNYVPGPIKTKPDNWTDVFLIIPAICFGYQCHVSVIPIYSCMKPRNLGSFIKAITLAIIICVFTYTIAATYGYLTFGSKITADVLESYNANDPSVLIAIIAIAIKTYTTYPILLFCGREAVSNIWMDLCCRTQPSGDDFWFERFRRISIASVWFGLTLLLAVFLPNIGIIIKLLGSLAAVFIFVFPGMCLLKVCLEAEDSENQLSIINPSRGSTFSAWILPSCSVIFISIGAFLFGSVFTQAIIFDFIQDNVADIPLCTPPKDKSIFYLLT